jgi:adenylate cyclase
MATPQRLSLVEPDQPRQTTWDRQESAALDRRVVRRLSVAIVAANVFGGVLVFVFLVYVAPTAVGPGWDEGSLGNLIAFVIFMPLATATGWRLSYRIGAPVRAWVRAGRMPDEREREITVRLPLLLTAVSAGIWASAALLFSALNAPRSAGLALQVGVTVLLGGLATCALIYLAVERVQRPVIARALAAGPPPRPGRPGLAARLVLAWAFGTGVAVLGVVLVAGASLAGGDASADRIAVTVLFLSILALGAGLAAALIAARSVADPVDSVRRALAELEGGNVAIEVPVDDGSEVGALQAGFNRMVAGLRERDQIRDLFGRHVGEDVAREALTRGIELGGEARQVAVLFVDVVGSTSLAAARDPAEVVEILNRFFAVVVEVTTEHGGWVNKFEGDAALCVFGAPTPHPDAARGALAAGRTLNVRLRAELPDVEAAIGLSAGPVVAGNVGAAERYEYTVIGDPVNEAARLTELAKDSPSRVLASDAIVGAAGAAEAERWAFGESVTLRGRASPTTVATPS